MKRSSALFSGWKVWILVGAAALAFLPGCSRTPEARYARYMESGKRYAAKKDYARAALQFANAAKALPKDAEARYRLGLAYLDAGEAGRGRGQLELAVTFDPKHTAAKLKLAQLLSYSGDPELLAKAEKTAEEVLAGSPDDPEASDVAALAELRLRKPEDARQHLEQALAKAPARLKSAVMLAGLKLAQKDAAGAEAVLRRAAEADPKSIMAAWTLGRFYVLLRRDNDAETQFQRALALDPKHGRSILELAGVRTRQGKRDEAEGLYRRASQLPGGEFRGVHAMFLLREGRLEPAIAELRGLVNSDPKDRAARSRLVSALARTGKFAEADQVLSAALKVNSKDVDALYQRAGLLFLQGKLGQAESDLTEVLRIRPNFGAGHLLMARLQRARGEPVRARDELNEALRADPGLTAARLELFRLLLTTNNAKTALDVWNQAPEPDKASPAMRVQRVWALIAVGDSSAARREVDALLKIGRVTELLLQDGTLRAGQKDYAGARAVLEEASAKSPEDARVVESLMRIHRMQNQPAAGLAWLREHISRHPKSPMLQTILGQHLAANGRADEARQAFSAALAMSPRATAPKMALAELDFSQRKLPSARAHLTELLAWSPLHVPAMVLMGNVEELSGQRPAAMARYRKVLEVDRRNLVALNNLAFLLAEDAGRPDEALTYAQQAAELAPNSPAIQDTIGWVYYQKGLYGTAVRYLENAASARGATAQRHYHLAMACLKAGQSTRGLQALETAMKLDPNLPEARLARQALLESRK